MARIIETLLNNAMLYKDTVQWLRTGVFVMMFFGLLLLGEAVACFVALGSDNPGTAGPALFYPMEFIAGIYALLVAFHNASQTTRELRAGTFELYALTGLTQDQLLQGKLLSMLAQLGFGLFCIAPYLFVAYVLGGIDFYQVAGAPITIIFWAIPCDIVALIAAFQPPQIHLLARIFTLGCLTFLTLFFIPVIVGALSETISAEMWREGIAATLIRDILALNLWRMFATLFVLMLYGAGVSFFYLILAGRLTTAVPAMAAPACLRAWHPDAIPHPHCPGGVPMATPLTPILGSHAAVRAQEIPKRAFRAEGGR